MVRHLGHDYYERGLQLEKVGDVAGAFDAFRRSAKADPRVAAPFVGLARILLRNSQKNEATACLERAVAIEPDNIGFQSMLGRFLSENGQLDAARVVFEKALSKNCDAPEPLLGLGSVLEDLGEREAAATTYRRLLDANPGFAEGYAGYLAVADSRELHGVINEAHKRLSNSNDRDAALIGYALGKAFARIGSDGEAFEAWARANAARRRDTGGFDRDAFDQRIERLCSLFTAKSVAVKRHWGFLSERPVFVVGLPRSGTTLTEQVLSAHTKIHGAGELDLLTDLATGLPDRLGPECPPWPDAVAELKSDQVFSVGSDYVQKIEKLSPYGVDRVIDKQPLNFWHLGLAAIALPNARIIHCRRDIRDCGLSIFSENFTPEQRWATDLSDIAYYWHGYRRLMNHWRDVSGLEIIDVNYEQIVDDIDQQSRQLINFVGLDWEDSVLEFHKNERAVQTPSRWQVRQPLYKSSSGRWRKYECNLGPLINAAKEIK